MKLKNLCLAVLSAYSCVGTNAIHGAQRFMNLARYATAMSSFSTQSSNPRKLSAKMGAVAARCSQAFQTVKQSKTVQWATDHKIALAGTGIAAGLIANEMFALTDYSLLKPIKRAESPEAIEIKTRLEALFASQGITIKINHPLPDGDILKEYDHAETLTMITTFEKEEKTSRSDLISFFIATCHRISPIDTNTIALTLLNSYDNTATDESLFSIGWLFHLLSNDEDKVRCMKELIENGALTYADTYDITSILNELPSAQRAPLALLLFEKSFLIECLIPFLKELPLEEKINCINRLIESKKLQEQSRACIAQIFNLLDPAQQVPLVSLFLEKSFDDLSIEVIEILLEELPLENRIIWIKRLIEKENLSGEPFYVIRNIFDLLPYKQRVPLLCLFFETSLGTLRQGIPEILLEKLLVEDRIKCIKQLLENGKIEPKNLSALHTMCSTVPREQRTPLTLLFLEKYLDALSEYDITGIMSTMLPEDRILWIKQLIETRKLETKPFSIIHRLFSSLPSPEDEHKLALLFLEKSFDTLDAEINAFLIAKLSLNTERRNYTEKLIRTKNIGILDPEVIDRLFTAFYKEEKSELASFFLENSFNPLLENGSLCALPIIINQLSSEIEKADYLYQVIESKKIETFDADYIDTMLEPLSPEERSHWALLFLEESYGDLPDSTIKKFLNYCPEGLKEFWFEEFAKKNKILKSFISELTQGPFFSFEFMMQHHASIFFEFNEDKEKHAEFIIKNAGVFAAQEYAKGNVVLFHGQHDQWAFFEKVFKALLKIKYDKITPKDFTWIRFLDRALLSDEEVAEIRKDGVTRKTYNNYRPKILFTNLHLLANNPGSNSLHYVLSNSDQSACSHFDPTIIENQFVELGMEQEYEQLQKEDPQFFKKLYQLYKKAVIARGNVGSLIGISLRKDIASKLCYSTEAGGPLNPHTIDGESTTDVSKIGEKYHQVAFHNEHALPLSKLITNPEEAAAAEVVMKRITSESTEESIKLDQESDAEFSKGMNHVAELHKERMAKEGKS